MASINAARRRSWMGSVVMWRRCWTGRRWLNIGMGRLAIGFGPTRPIERIWWRGRLVWYAGSPQG